MTLNKTDLTDLVGRLPPDSWTTSTAGCVAHWAFDRPGNDADLIQPAQAGNGPRADRIHAATAAGTVRPDTPDSLEPSVSYTAPMPSRANVDPVGQNS